LEYLQVCIIIDIFHILPYTQLQILGGAKFCNSGRERVSLITHSDLRIHVFYNRRSFCLKLQRLYADINPNFSDVHQKGPKKTGIGPWPHYREQPQNLDRISIKIPEGLRSSFENEGNKLYIGVNRKDEILSPAFSSLML
jgi:hypothetical protein